ncbi:uncharacterized protein K452DRAFT_355968 [Aplosporella prunicola CBS 121167]|uniref:2',3'-cyclic-nucleotide 3'-phosphodiesterase n=1 Tax=Aplosporella prunicola CBS 121167 TaxID=1176127 RepID=A0A6A6BSH4_9PEZI|nr:uncharacterized protein K452DRAFT_355968 [Aplosporella prunicola CBS 121167]KAF2145531.1 hypothetical protein K452DRAFT_355968 [Aplosporella prunicola CBS 121167]
MPGCSLWLVPPEGSAISTTLSTLISEILPKHFPDASPPTFVPHVTLTSDIAPSVFSPALDESQQKSDAQAWIDQLPNIPKGGDVVVKFQALDVGEAFVKKLTLRVEKGGVKELAFRARMYGVEKGGAPHNAEEWVKNSYGPHNSLVYGDMPISDEKKSELQKLVEEAGISINGSGNLGGWKGGDVWLVPTFKNFADWQPWAKRAL